MSGTVAAAIALSAGNGGGNGYQPNDIADKQQRRAGKGRKGWRRWAEEPQFARQPDHDQSHGDKVHAASVAPPVASDNGDKQRADYQ